jgi:hypothetical protein
MSEEAKISGLKKFVKENKRLFLALMILLLGWPPSRFVVATGLVNIFKVQLSSDSSWRFMILFLGWIVVVFSFTHHLVFRRGWKTLASGAGVSQFRAGREQKKKLKGQAQRQGEFEAVFPTAVTALTEYLTRNPDENKMGQAEVVRVLREEYGIVLANSNEVQAVMQELMGRTLLFSPDAGTTVVAGGVGGMRRRPGRGGVVDPRMLDRKTLNALKEVEDRLREMGNFLKSDALSLDFYLVEDWHRQFNELREATLTAGLPVPPLMGDLEIIFPLLEKSSSIFNSLRNYDEKKIQAVFSFVEEIEQARKVMENNKRGFAANFLKALGNLMEDQVENLLKEIENAKAFFKRIKKWVKKAQPQDLALERERIAEMLERERIAETNAAPTVSIVAINIYRTSVVLIDKVLKSRKLPLAPRPLKKQGFLGKVFGDKVDPRLRGGVDTPEGRAQARDSFRAGYPNQKGRRVFEGMDFRKGKIRRKK